MGSSDGEINRSIWNTFYPVGADRWKRIPPTVEMHDCLELFEEAGYQRVLDLGCGIGRWAHFFAHCGFDVTGVDFSEHAVTIAAAWGKELGSSAVFRCADISAGTSGERYDAVIAAMVLDELSPLSARHVARQIEDVLVPGGGLYLSVNPLLNKQQIDSLQQIDSMTRDLRIFYRPDDEVIADFKAMTVVKYWDHGPSGRAWFLRKAGKMVLSGL